MRDQDGVTIPALGLSDRDSFNSANVFLPGVTYTATKSRVGATVWQP